MSEKTESRSGNTHRDRIETRETPKSRRIDMAEITVRQLCGNNHFGLIIIVQDVLGARYQSLNALTAIHS